MNLSATQQAAALKKLVAAGKKGHDAEALVERAARLGLDRTEAMAKLARFDVPPSGTPLERLEKHLGEKAAKKAAASRLAKAWERGARAALDDTLPMTDSQRLVALNDEVDRQRLRAEAADIVKAERAGQGDEGDDYADVAALIEQGVEQRTPDAGGIRSDGARLSYRGAVNGLVGPPESGKTLVAIAQACDDLKAGERVLHIDADHNGPAATLSHYLTADGIEADVLADRARFRYVEVRSADHLRRVVAEATAWRPTLVVVDSVGEVVPLFGGDSNSNDDYRRIHREILSPLADLGAAVLVLDHESKANGPGGYAIGASAKKAAIDGSYLAVSPVEPFVPGQGGAAALSILKDRHGGLRAVSPSGKNPTAAVFRLDSRGGVTTHEFYPGKGADERADDRLDSDVAFVLALPEFPASRTALQAAVRAKESDGKGWNNNRAHAALQAARQRRTTLTTFPIDDPTTTKEGTK